MYLEEVILVDDSSTRREFYLKPVYTNDVVNVTTDKSWPSEQARGLLHHSDLSNDILFSLDYPGSVGWQHF